MAVLDWDLLRLRAAGARFVHLPRLLGAFRFHSRQKSETMTDDVGAAEMRRLRLGGLGFAPSRPRIRWQIAPFALRCALAGLRDEPARPRVGARSRCRTPRWIDGATGRNE